MRVTCVILARGMVARSIHVAKIFIRRYIERIGSGVAVRVEGSVAGEGRVVVYQSFIPGVSAPCH